MNSEKLETLLQSKMKTNTFMLTQVLETFTKQITDGFIGYQITEGLWIKLRIYICLYKDQQLIFEEVLNEAFWEFKSAKERVNQTLKEYN